MASDEAAVSDEAVIPDEAVGFGEAAEVDDAAGFHGGAGPRPELRNRLRNTVRQQLVARQLDEQIAANFPPGQRLKVLDAGLDHGTQALRLARAGHQLTGMSADPAMLDAVRGELRKEPAGVRKRVRIVADHGRETGAHFLPGTFDVVLCHGALMYAEEPGPMLAGLARVLAPGGLLSLLVRNGDAPAMRPGLAGDWSAAAAAFGTGGYTNRLGLRVGGGADRLGPLSASLTGIGAPLRTWYGVRVFTESAPDGAPVPGAAEFERLLVAEERAGRTDPYRAVAALLHVCGVRG